MAGLWRWWATPRVEDPQIEVPTVDVLIRFPAAPPPGSGEAGGDQSVRKKLWEMDGLEDVYSQARARLRHRHRQVQGGEDREKSLFKLYDQVLSNLDEDPPGVTGWVVKPMSIDEVLTSP